ncbi:Rab-like protein 2A-like [Homarus americanus]|uniref:Rab-like protein 2A-like n=1 Tax=Homarus americanus TaxID=6706 RepID=A0A8J5TK63_HOMAM|nr:Rab-like protein 2A-like [Homarus americanus]
MLRYLKKMSQEESPGKDAQGETTNLDYDKKTSKGELAVKAHAAILVFDGTRKVTYKNLPNWYKELRQHRPEIPCFCAVNKIDENEDIAGKSFAFPEKNNIPMYYVSASSGTNVVKLFKDAIRAAFQYKKNPTDFTDQIMEELEMDL